MGKRFTLTMLIMLFCLGTWGTRAFAAESAQAVVQSGTNQIVQILSQYPQNTRARREQIHAVVDKYFDFEAMSRLAVGPRWSSLPPEKQKEFEQEFTKLLFNTYVGDIEKYARQRATFGTRPISQGYVVVREVVRDQNGSVSLDYYMHMKDGNWKVFDVAAEGMSIVTNYRDQFSSILTNGSFDDLSRMLRQQIAQICGTNRC